MVLEIKDANKNNIYVPELAKINRIQQISPTEKLFDIVFDDKEKH